MSNEYDIIIVGGGVIGCAIAYYLLHTDDSLNIAVIEMDPTYRRASTTLSEGNIRVQFNIKENIQMSMYGLQILREFPHKMAVGDENLEVSFRHQGNLFIIDSSIRAEAEQGYALQRRMGCEVEWLSPEQVQQRYPFYNLEGCVGGTFGHQDGTMSTEAVLTGYRKKAVALGAKFIHTKAERMLVRNDRILGVELSTKSKLTAGTVVNAAGAWAPVIARTAGVDLPIAPTKRQVTVLETTLHPNNLLPPIFFPSGLYCMHEGEGIFTCARSYATDPVGYEDFRWDREHFENNLWGELVAMMPAFDRVKINGGWAGLYAVNTFDGNAILGEWPSLRGLFLANGFSGHGFQQCHAVGRYIAELILGQTLSLNLALFSPQRILDNKPIFESENKII